MKNNERQTAIDDVDFDNFSLSKKEITVNGKPLPLKIGDRFMLSNNDKLYKTVIAITVFEDGRTSYTIEWYDPEACRFENETVTLTELKLLNRKTKATIKNIGFEK